MIAKVDERLQGPATWASSSRPAAKELLAERGYDPVLGARPLRRTIQREIEDMLSEKILFGELRPGQIVRGRRRGRGRAARLHLPRRAEDGVPEPATVGAAAAEPSSLPVDLGDVQDG